MVDRYNPLLQIHSYTLEGTNKLHADHYVGMLISLLLNELAFVLWTTDVLILHINTKSQSYESYPQSGNDYIKQNERVLSIHCVDKWKKNENTQEWEVQTLFDQSYHLESRAEADLQQLNMKKMEEEKTT